MVRVVIQDSSSVTVSGLSVNGPVTFDADSVLVGASTYESGSILVTSSGVVPLASSLPGEAFTVWGLMFCLFIVGLGKFSTR